MGTYLVIEDSLFFSARFRQLFLDCGTRTAVDWNAALMNKKYKTG